MYYSGQDIQEMDRVERLNLMNSISGIKPVNLIGTKSTSGHSNLAIISSVVHLGSSPALIGFIVRPRGEYRRDTYDNIKENECYTINHVNREINEKAHYTSAKFEADESEFERCNLTEEYIANFPAPFVRESAIKLGLRFEQEIPIELNGTTLIIGEVVHVIVPQTVKSPNGYLDLEVADSMGVSGLNRYYSLQKENDFPFARVHNLPDLK